MAVTKGTYAARPSSHSAGDIYLTTDSYWDYLVSNGASWSHLFCGFECIPPSSADFTWVNQGGATISTVNGGVSISVPASATNNRRLRVKEAPAYPYTLTSIVIPTFVGGVEMGAAIGLRESNTGKLTAIAVMATYTGFAFSSISTARIVSPTSSGDTLTATSVIGTVAPSSAIWLQITYDGSDISYSFSVDGRNFNTLFAETKAAHFTVAPDQVWFGCDVATASYSGAATFIHWSLPSPSTSKAFGFLGRGAVNGSAGNSAAMLS